MRYQTALHPDSFGRGSRNRTHGTWFWRPLLYQLSYTPISLGEVLSLQLLFLWRRRWDSNPCGPYTNPNGLANRPLQPLEYFSRLFFLLLAERVGFEPTVPFGITGFQDQLLKPLGHLSIMSSTSFLFLLKNGDPSEIRTPDTLIKSQVLCQLS